MILVENWMVICSTLTQNDHSVNINTVNKKKTKNPNVFIKAPIRYYCTWYCKISSTDIWLLAVVACFLFINIYIIEIMNA